MRLADTVGRTDWWNVYDEHTPYQWALQRARAVVDPWGDDRADQRSGMQTLTLIQSQRKEPLDLQARKAVLSSTMEYTQASQRTELGTEITAGAIDAVIPG